MRPLILLIVLCNIAVHWVLAAPTVTASATAAFAEIVQFPASAAYLANHSVLDSALKLLKLSLGVIDVYYGVQIEDPTIGLIVVGEFFRDAVPVISTPITSIIDLAVASGGTVTIKNMGMTNNGDSIFTAPVSEFAQWTLHPGKTFADATPGADAIMNRLDVTEGMFPPSIFGQSTKDPAFFIILAGWESLNAHETASSSPAFLLLINDVLAIADLLIFHATLSKL